MPTLRKRVFDMLDLGFLRDYDFRVNDSGLAVLSFQGKSFAVLGEVQTLLQLGVMSADRGGEHEKGYVFLMLCEERSSKIYPDFDSCLFSCASEHHEKILLDLAAQTLQGRG